MKDQKDTERKKAARRSIEPPPKERFELLMEQVLDKVSAIGEGHTAIRHELAEFRSDVDERFAETNAKIDFVARSLNEKIDAVARDLKEHRADTAAHLVIH